MASPPSNPKRQRTSEPSPAHTAVPDRFSTFFNDPQADVILRSVDGALFATRRAYLIGPSSVLEDMFAVPQPVTDKEATSKDGQAAPGILPVVQMSETGPELEVFLRWIHRDTFEDLYRTLEEASGLEGIVDYFVSLNGCAKKYDVKAIEMPLRRLVEQHVEDDPPNVLALAVLFEWKSLAMDAVKVWFTRTEACIAAIAIDRDIAELYPPCSIADIWPALFVRLPRGLFFYIAMAEKHLVYHREVTRTDMQLRAFEGAYDDGFPMDVCLSPSPVRHFSLRTRTHMLTPTFLS